MNQEIIKKIENWVTATSESSDHLLRTGFWVNELEPNISDEVYIACITHDIEIDLRSEADEQFYKQNFGKLYETGDWSNREYNLWHGMRSAGFVMKFLELEGRGNLDEIKILRLIQTHEFGGGDEQNLVKDADSLSFLDVQVDTFVKKVPDVWPKESVRKKFDWMFERITKEKAKEIAKPMYEKAISRLSSRTK